MCRSVCTRKCNVSKGQSFKKIMHKNEGSSDSTFAHLCAYEPLGLSSSGMRRPAHLGLVSHLHGSNLRSKENAILKEHQMYLERGEFEDTAEKKGWL